MNKYEGTIILNPNVTEERTNELVEKFSAIINENGKMVNVENLGKRKLAYEIRKNNEGIYVIMNFEAQPEVIKELERNYKINDEVIKFLTIRLED